MCEALTVGDVLFYDRRATRAYSSRSDIAAGRHTTQGAGKK